MYMEKNLCRDTQQEVYGNFELHDNSNSIVLSSCTLYFEEASVLCYNLSFQILSSIEIFW